MSEQGTKDGKFVKGHGVKGGRPSHNLGMKTLVSRTESSPYNSAMQPTLFGCGLYIMGRITFGPICGQ